MSRIVEFADYRAVAPSVVTIGVFDGFHRGHQRLVAEVVDQADAASALATAITFEPAPRAVLRPDSGYTYLTGLEERLDLLGQTGLDVIAILRFDRTVAQTSAAAFMDILAERFRALALVVGPDFSLGRGREGSLPVLTELGAARGIAVNPVSPLRLGRERISSSMIRELVHAGDVRGAARLLGHPPTVRGPVVRGDGRGHQLGIPTANLDIPAGHCLPPNGIYACLAKLPGGSQYAAAVSIGTRPTFGPGPRTVEAFLLDFAGDLYDREITLAFVERLRDELRFDGVAALLAQIDHDVAETRDLIGRFQSPSRAEPVPSA